MKRLATPVLLLSLFFAARPASAVEGLFWASDGGGIFGSALNGASQTTLWNATSFDLALDRFGNRLFWGQGTSVMTGAADGTGSATPVSSVSGINAILMAYDAAHRRPPSAKSERAVAPCLRA